MSHKNKSIQSSSKNPAKMLVEKAIAAITGSDRSGKPGGPPDRPLVRQTLWGRRPRWIRRLLWICAIMAAVIVVLRIILWLSLPQIINKTMAQYGLETHYERLTLSLLSGDAELWHLTLVPTGTNIPMTDVEYCRAEISLLTLLTNRLVVPRLEIDGMDVNLTRAEDGTFPQLQTLLEVLRQRKIAAQQAAVPTTPTAASPQNGLLPALKMDALRLQHMQVRFQDKSVTPVFETQMDLNIRLSDLQSDTRKTRFQIILSSPPVLDQLLIEGTNSGDQRDLLADVQVALHGLHPGTIKDYLADLGLISDARDISFACAGSILVQEKQVADANDVNSQGKQKPASDKMAALSSSPTLQVHLESNNTVLTVDGLEHFNLEHVAVDANVPGPGIVHVGKVLARHGEFHAWKRATGALSVAGFQFVGRPQPKPQVMPDATGASGSVNKSPGQWSLDGVEVNDIRFVLHDESVSPRVDLVMNLNEASIASLSPQSEEMALAARLNAPGIIESFQVGGTMKLSSTDSRTALKLSGTGIRPDLLGPHLKRLGIESLYKGGAFQCDANARFAQSKGGALEGSASITNISMQDTDELFGLKAVTVNGVRIDPGSGTTHIDQVEVSGQRLALGRDANGCLIALGFRFAGTPSSTEQGQASTSTQPKNNGTAAAKPMARIEIGRISWHDNQLTFVDQMVKPAKTFTVPDLGFELTNLVLSGGSASPAAVKVWLSSPRIIEHVELNGTMTPQLSGLSFDLSLNGEGLALAEVSPYLLALGVEPTMTKGSVDANMNGQVTWQDQGINCSVTVGDLFIKDGDIELAGFKQMDIAQFGLADTGMRAKRITIKQPRLTLSREKSDAFSFVGLRTLLGLETPSKPQPKKSQPALPVRVDHLEVTDARILWSDQAVVPSVTQAAEIDLTLTDLALGVEASPATIACIVRVPGTIQQATISGQVQTTPTKQGTDLKIEAAGINAGPLLSYLPTSCKPALHDGKFSARIVTDLMQNPDGGQRFHVNIADVDYRQKNSQQEPFLHFDSAKLDVDRFDPNSLISIQQLSLVGLQAAVNRTASGRISLMGLEIGPSEPVSVSNPPAADKKPDRLSGRTRNKPQFPLVVLEHLSLQASKLTINDQSRSKAAPIVISDLQIGNTEEIKLLGSEPDTNLPVKIDIHGRIQSLAESMQLKLEVSPFVAQPRILAQWDISQIHGPGLTSVFPELQTAMDANNMLNGRFSGSARLSLRMDRRSVVDFDLSKPFGVNFSVKDVLFSDTETKAVLAGLGELRAAIPKVDTKNNIFQVKELSLAKLQGAVSREADGIHMLGLTLKTSAPTASTDANTITAPSGTDANGAMAQRVEASQEQAKPLDLSVDQFLLNGVDFNFVDRTVEPPMYLSLKGLDIEVRGYTTRRAKEPMRFNIVATAGQVPLQKTKHASALQTAAPVEGSLQDSSEPSTAETRLLFQEMTASGRLTLYPRPDGWVKAGLSGLELADFKGQAKQRGLILRDGVFDSSMDIRFSKDKPTSIRSRLVFTNLSLTEPPDGFLAKLLTIPVSLDTALFILSDADGSIQVPLSFKMDENGLSRGQMTQAALGAAASVIGSAIAGSPFRIAGSIGNMVGGQKGKTNGAETQVVQYAPGVTTLSQIQADQLAKIKERLRHEKDLSVTIRHTLGGGDIEKAGGLVNLSSVETKDLLAKLRQNRSQLRRQRNELASQTRVAFSAGASDMDAKTKRMQEIEAQLGMVERAVDDLLETMRRSTEYASKRRTRDACIAIGKSRLETLFASLSGEEVPNGAERVTVISPRFTEADDSAGGSITLTFSKNKAR